MRRASPLERERLAWTIGDAECRALERCARAAMRERAAEFGPATEALFDLVSRTELLPRVAPRGRVPRDFAARCLRVAGERRARLDAEAAALAVAQRLVRSHSLPSRDRARLARHARRYPGEPEEGLARGQIGIPGTRYLIDRRGALRERAVLPGSSIVVAPPLRSGKTSLRAVADPRGAVRAARRLGRALALLDAAWPDAGREVRARTRLVLPLAEAGLVSFSLPSRPGVSFINLRGKSVVDLADDLLHETAHHRLHAIERRGPLVAKKVLAADAPRLWSSWRRAQRPVRGILHAAYTFAYRTELLARLAAVSKSRDAARRLEAESSRERRRVQDAIVDLRKAARQGLLTLAGRRLLRPIHDAVQDISG